MIYQRISPVLFRHQSNDQHGFTPQVRIEDALLCAEQAIEYSLEFSDPLWLMSIDMRKAFDTIEHGAIFQSLSDIGIDEGYITLLRLLYQNQTGSVNGSDSFDIDRGVKQGDVLSAVIFNCVLDMAFEAWKLRLSDQGLYIGPGLCRLTNSRYADDILLYAKSIDELIQMSEMLIDELAKVGLRLNTRRRYYDQIFNSITRSC